MKRIAIVVPRCHESLVGGAEAHAWQYATLLADSCAVEVLTTTASDYVNWANDLPAGEEWRDGVLIRRFRVARGRTGYFHDLHRRLLAEFAASAGAAAAQRVRWPEALQDEFIRAQGPVSHDLVAHLAQHGDDYAAVIFLTYLYPTTHDGSRVLGHRRWGIVPTLHDEPPAYLRVVAELGARVPRILWNTPAERRLAARLWSVDAGNIVAMTVATAPVTPAREAAPYLLYCGRIDSHKGCAMLIDAFRAYRRARGTALELVLTGADTLGVKSGEGVRYLGFVDEARKFALMAGAVAFVQPSPNESLSIVLLEAMAQGTPAIVNGACEVLADHVHDSGSGYVFNDVAQLHAAIDTAMALDETARADQARRARGYVLEHYARDSVRARLVAEIEALAAA